MQDSATACSVVEWCFFWSRFRTELSCVVLKICGIHDTLSVLYINIKRLLCFRNAGMCSRRFLLVYIVSIYCFVSRSIILHQKTGLDVIVFR